MEVEQCRQCHRVFRGRVSRNRESGSSEIPVRPKINNEEEADDSEDEGSEEEVCGMSGSEEDKKEEVAEK